MSHTHTHTCVCKECKESRKCSKEQERKCHKSSHKPKISSLYIFRGFLDGSVKNPPAVQKIQETWVHPWVGKIPWSRKWQPAPVRSHVYETMYAFVLSSSLIQQTLTELLLYSRCYAWTENASWKINKYPHIFWNLQPAGWSEGGQGGETCDK